MSVLKRKNLVTIHMLVAGFIFPVLLMFLFTGALYTWGIKGGYESQDYDVMLEAPLQADQEMLLAVVNKKLLALNITQPTGQAKVKNIGADFQLQWTGSNRNVILQTSDNALLARMTIENSQAYRVFVQLHKAKGGVAFKVYAAIFAAALLLLLISGFIMAWQMPKYRQPVLISATLGMITFILMIVIS
ncbi:MAG: PepSY domain-containing protein [Pseudomonadales bacterium]|nr:PepSY domain-containing protein [Pseudomonadales bacterium]